MKPNQTELETRLENLLNSLSDRAVSYQKTNDFFVQCIENVAEFYEVDYAFIGLLDDIDNQLINTFIVWNQGKLLDNFQYNLNGTPCQDVINLKHEIIENGAACRYPDDKMLLDMNIESYFGAPLISVDGRLLGLFSIMGTKELDIQSWMIAVLNSVAARFSLELERFQAEQRLQLLNKELSHKELYDSLTGIWNRDAIDGSIIRHQSAVGTGQSHVFLYIDLDKFQVINDTLGHVAGDELLQQIPPLLEKNIRDSDLLARLGGDEFGVVLEHCELSKAEIIASNILTSISEYQFQWADKKLRVTASIGIAVISDDTRSENIMSLADLACHVAKDSGGNKYLVYKRDDHEIASHADQMDWLSNIVHALKHDQFVLYAQPIVPIENSSGSQNSYELLIRMKQKNEIIPPGSFLPAAERYNQMIDIDRWVIFKAISMFKDQEELLSGVDHISINLSGRSLANENFCKFVISEIGISNLSNKVCFEITETEAIKDLATARKRMGSIKQVGARFSLDDFGSGVSSFSYLRELDIDYIKIDGSFVKSIEDNLIDRAIVSSIYDIGSLMGKKIIAEYVENNEILELLKEIGVDYAQGYGIGKPEPLADILGSNLNAD